MTVELAMRFWRRPTIVPTIASATATSSSPVLPAKARIAANLTSGNRLVRFVLPTWSYHYYSLATTTASLAGSCIMP